MTKRALLINLTRFGDLLQTQPAVSGLKAGGYDVGLATMENFHAAAGLLRDVEWAAPLPGSRLLARTERSWPEGLAELHGFLGRVRDEFSPDLAVNLTPSLSARLLARNLPAAERRGFGLDEHGFNADTPSWAAFLQIASEERGASPFNICDLFRRVCGLTGPGADLSLRRPDRAAVDAASERLFAAVPSGTPFSGFAALQLGASEERRRWPVEHFAELASRLWTRERLVSVLVGGAGEKPLGDRLRTMVDCPVVDLMGATDLEQLAATLTCCGLLATNDTGTMHLAAGLAVPVVAVFLATAQPWDTGPYRAGSLCLEPDEPCHPCAFGTECPHGEKCRRSVTVDAVWACARRQLGRRGEAEDFSGARVWRSAWADAGLLGLQSLSGHGDTGRVRWIELQRDCYRHFLDGEDMDEYGGGPDGATGDGSLSSSPERTGTDAATSAANGLAEAEALLFLLRQQGALLGRDPRAALKSKFLAGCQRIPLALRAHPSLRVLASLWIFESQNHARDFPGLLSLIDRFHGLCRALLRSIG